MEGDAGGKINSAGKYKNEDWQGREKEGTTERRKRGREQRKLGEFDAPFLSVNGTVIVKAARAVASLVAGEVDVIVSIAGLPCDSDVSLSRVPRSLGPSSSYLGRVLCPTGRFEAEAHKEPRVSSVQNQEAHESGFRLVTKFRRIQDSGDTKFVRPQNYSLQNDCSYYLIKLYKDEQSLTQSISFAFIPTRPAL